MGLELTMALERDVRRKLEKTDKESVEATFNILGQTTSELVYVRNRSRHL
jgi:hypothetical protein